MIMKDFRFVLTDGNGNMVCEPITYKLADEQSVNDFLSGMRIMWRRLHWGERLNIVLYRLNIEKNLWEYWLQFSEF